MQIESALSPTLCAGRLNGIPLIKLYVSFRDGKLIPPWLSTKGLGPRNTKVRYEPQVPFIVEKRVDMKELLPSLKEHRFKVSNVWAEAFQKYSEISPSYRMGFEFTSKINPLLKVHPKTEKLLQCLFGKRGWLFDVMVYRNPVLGEYPEHFSINCGGKRMGRSSMIKARFELAAVNGNFGVFDALNIVG